MSSLQILLVLSRNRVSLGDILWNTTFWMEDFPLRRSPINRIRGLTSGFKESLKPNPAREENNAGVHAEKTTSPHKLGHNRD